MKIEYRLMILSAAALLVILGLEIARYQLCVHAGIAWWYCLLK